MNALNQLVEAVRIELRARATANHLMSRGDRVLADVGLSRADILRVSRIAAAHEGRVSLAEILATLGPAETAVETTIRRSRALVDGIARFVRGLPPVTNTSTGVVTAR